MVEENENTRLFGPRRARFEKTGSVTIPEGVLEQVKEEYMGMPCFDVNLRLVFLRPKESEISV